MNTVWIDMDGVVADLVGATLKAFNRSGLPGDEPLEEEDIDTYDAIVNKCGTGYWKQSGWWNRLPVYPQGHDLVNRVRFEARATAGVDWAFLSKPYAPHIRCYEEKMEWLAANFGVGQHRFVAASDKSLVFSPGDLVIEDAPHFIEQAISKCATIICIAQPWNTSVDVMRYDYHGAIEAVSDWFTRYRGMRDE